MNRISSTILLLLLNVAMFGQAPDYQNNGWKEWYFSNGSVACKVSQWPREDDIMAYHITPEPNGTLMVATYTGWRCVGTEGNYNLYEPWEYVFRTDVWSGRMWNEWKRKKMDGLVLKIAKDWSEIVYPEHGLSWYNHAQLNRVSQQQYKATVRAQEESLAKAQAKYGTGGGNIQNSSPQSGSQYQNTNNSSKRKRCSECGGSTICSRCHGEGGSWENTGYYTGSGTKSWINCPRCGGSTKCFLCRGTGFQPGT